MEVSDLHGLSPFQYLHTLSISLDTLHSHVKKISVNTFFVAYVAMQF